MSLEEYRILEKDHNIGPFLCLRSVLQFMLKQEFKENSVSGRLTRGAIVILTSLASEGSLFGVGNHMLPKDTVKGLVQTAGKPVLLINRSTCSRRVPKHLRTPEREFESMLSRSRTSVQQPLMGRLIPYRTQSKLYSETYRWHAQWTREKSQKWLPFWLLLPQAISMAKCLWWMVELRCSWRISLSNMLDFTILHYRSSMTSILRQKLMHERCKNRERQH